jgi:hypothetical protein
MASQHEDALVLFIRHTLGCECPDEVLRSMSCNPRLVLPRVVDPVARVDVGGRLLVYVVTAVQESGELASLIASATDNGVADRDRGGFNRFRLVLATPNADEINAAARQAFAACHLPDERIHFHVVPLAEVPEVVRPGSS